MSPRKVRLVADLIRGMNVNVAEQQLQFHPKWASRPLLKLLRSAIANATNNFHLDRKDLRIAKITVDQGPTMKRYRPRAFGSSAMIRKRSSHINLVLISPEKSKKEQEATKAKSGEKAKEAAAKKGTQKVEKTIAEKKQESKKGKQE